MQSLEEVLTHSPWASSDQPTVPDAIQAAAVPKTLVDAFVKRLLDEDEDVVLTTLGRPQLLLHGELNDVESTLMKLVARQGAVHDTESKCAAKALDVLIKHLVPVQKEDANFSAIALSAVRGMLVESAKVNRASS